MAADKLKYPYMYMCSIIFSPYEFHSPLVLVLYVSRSIEFKCLFCHQRAVLLEKSSFITDLRVRGFTRGRKHPGSRQVSQSQGLDI